MCKFNEKLCGICRKFYLWIVNAINILLLHLEKCALQVFCLKSNACIIDIIFIKEFCLWTI